METIKPGSDKIGGPTETPKKQLTPIIVGISASMALLIIAVLITVSFCYCRVKRTAKRRKRRQDLERALSVTPLADDFYRVPVEDDENANTVSVPQQDPIRDVSTAISASEGATGQYIDHGYSRSASLTMPPSWKNTVVSIGAETRRNTLPVPTLTPSSSDSSLVSFNSEPDLSQAQLSTEAEGASPGKSKAKPVLKFSLYYSIQDSTLYVCLKSVLGLPRKHYPGCTSFLRLYLLPKFRDGFQTEVIRKSLNPHFNESFQFCKLSLSDAQSSFLRVKLYTREKWNRRDRFSGEVFAECLQLLQRTDELLEFQREFSAKRTKIPKKNMRRMRSRSTSKPEVTSRRPYLGDLFLSLQYTASAERLKVMVRKAENLMVDSVLPGQGDFYVTIRLLKHREVIQEHSTQRRSGTSPVWNQPFLFHPKHEDIHHHALMFSLFRGRRLGSDVIIGKVEVGSMAGETGVTHWNDMLQPRGTEVAKWHRIKPPFS